jgi:hypothetical protein
MTLHRVAYFGLIVLVVFNSTASRGAECPPIYHQEQVLSSVNPERIISISDEGGQSTVVWFPPQHVITHENPEALLARLGIIGLAFARFTRPDMKRVWVNVTAITEVRAPAPGLFAPGVNAVLFMGFNRQGVREDVQEANARIAQQRMLLAQRVQESRP